MVIPRQVYNELSQINYLKSKIDTMISSNYLDIEDIDIGSEEGQLYLKLTKNHISPNRPLIGKGEAAGIVLAKRDSGILASNNLKDISYYVKEYGLSHITTSEILKQAFDDSFISETEANNIWEKMIKKKRMLPFSTFTDYLKSLI
ncbi:MAG: hypothetical protein H6687_01845 [Bacillales bacterium]|nr:hypothetical protein [Bacillales bacterium]